MHSVSNYSPLACTESYILETRIFSLLSRTKKKAKEKKKRNKAINKGKKKKKKNSLDVNPNIYRVCWNYSFGN